MTLNRIVTGLLIISVSLVCPNYSPVAFAETCDQPVAVAVSVQGEVNMRKSGVAEWEPVKRQDEFCSGDTIRVLRQSRADLLLINETTLRLDQNTEIVFTAPKREKEFWLDVLLGGTYFMSRTPRTFQVNTPFVNAGVEGTEFFIGVEKDRALLTVFEGRITAANDLGNVILQSGQSAVAEAGRAPVLTVVARPRDAVRWTLFYPMVVPGAPSDWRGRAAKLLAVGRVEEAGAVIDEALKVAPEDADALSFQAVIAVAQNEKETALDLAKKAVAVAPKSANALVALSYAQQAGFDLEGALSTLEEAVKVEPANALARARLSELLLSFGRLDEALGEAKKAAGIDPDVARTQTVLGFAYLAQIRSKESRAAFEKAIGLDQADPLPHLGMGLAMIRDGDVEGGREEIEIAASLDPNNSLLRSYLGKAYYEEKRDGRAETQFDMAKEFDPNDPTPFFYDAIRKQSVNQPVEALHDMQKAISLNDNRAIYRSRLLLDEDLAARSASLGRIYSDLGFQQLALVEGWKSVNTDPANYSAHRFLADSYAALSRHEIARVSELLQSQLLQPININPVQPSLAERNLFILEGAGPSSPSFNEFNPMFYRNRLALQTSGIVGNNGTAGEEVVHSAVWNRLSYSLGQFHFETDGFRENNDQERNVYNAFAQVSVSHKTSILAEFRSFDSERGDLVLRFLSDDFSRTDRNSDEYEGGRIGFHHAFSPESDFIATAVYEDERFESLSSERTPVPFPPPGFVLESSTAHRIEDRVFGIELQQMLRWDPWDLVAGAGYIHIDREQTNDLSFVPNPPQDPLVFPPVFDHEVVNSRVRHTNGYLYFHLRCPNRVTWTLGASTDFFKDSLNFYKDREQFNPKAGVTWVPRAGTTIRAAAFRILRRTLPFTSQTIEPTQVAGFNQFFDDPGGSKAWRYGVAADQQITDHLFAGAEYSRRILEIPVQLSGPPNPTVIEWFDQKEWLGRAYSYWTPHPWLAISAEYLYERHEREADSVKEVRTHRIPLGIRFFHPCGAVAVVKGTYFDQEGKFFPSTMIGGTPEEGDERFWIFDASARYRLPNRWGIASIEAKNLFDRSFLFQDMDRGNPVIWPERTVVFKITMAL